MSIIKLNGKVYKFLSKIKDIKNKHTFIKSLKQSDYLIILNKQTNVLEYAIKLSILEENR
jgi:hypothetical protein